MDNPSFWTRVFWFGLIAGHVLLLLTVASLLRLRECPLGFVRLPVPCKSFVLYGAISQGVEVLFRRRRECRWFKLKAFINSWFLAGWTVWKVGGPIFKRPAYFNKRFAELFDSRLGGAQFYMLKPEWTLRTGGYAGTWCKSDKIILGLEQWAFGLSLFARSAVDHELTHCVQQVWCNALSDQWLFRRNCWQTLSGACRWFFFELQAILTNPVSSLWILLVLTAPALIYVDFVQRHTGIK